MSVRSPGRIARPDRSSSGSRRGCWRCWELAASTCPGGNTAHRGQLAALDAKVRHLSERLEALSEGGPKGPPMIAWHDLGADQAAAVRADLATWVGQVLFPLYPSARESVRDCWAQHPDAVTELSACWLEFRRIFAPAAPARPGKPAVRRPSLADTLVYLDRWLPGTLRRVKAITEKCTGIDGHIPPRGRTARESAVCRRPSYP